MAEKLIFKWDKDMEADRYIVKQIMADETVELVRIEKADLTTIYISNVKQNEENHFRVEYYKKKDSKYYLYREENYYCFLSGKSSTIYRLPLPELKQAIWVDGSVTISWEKVRDNVTYRVIKKTIGGKWKNLGLTKDTSYVDRKVDMEENCIYSVRCVSDDGMIRLSGFSLTGVSV